MLCFKDSNSPKSDASGIIDQKYLTVQKAEDLTGYNGQYLRRLLRTGRLQGVKVGQAWLIRLDSLASHISLAASSPDRRFGSRIAQVTLSYTSVNSGCLQVYTAVDKEKNHERHDS